MGRLSDIIADPYSPTSLSGRSRARRWAALASAFPDLGEMRVVDLGGDVRAWGAAPVKPREVVAVNLFPQESGDPTLRTVVGDACDLPDELRGERFDLAYSNSVIEHVGGHARRASFAEAVHSLAERHWVQTPYRYFPVEPHWVFPGFQFLPLRWRARLTCAWPIGAYEDVDDFDEAVDYALRIELLSVTAMRHYFPRSEIRVERALALPKSLVATTAR
ncbi:MAG: class I SAM-dependent methyltransferase [Thermoleophilaceae bacterium]